MRSPSVEGAIKLEKKCADRKLKELDRQSGGGGNLLAKVINVLVRDSLEKEKERLEKAEQAFVALDLNKLRSYFGFDIFFATHVRRFGDGGIFIGNLHKPIDEVIPKLERKLSEPELLSENVTYYIFSFSTVYLQARVVQPKSEMDLQFEATKLSTPLGYINAVALCVVTFGTIG
ncbi:hypothetical protein MLD38_022911 [Melastoma candidum]|uniref:Uncharacterized protein n=1 Tax=Melastoma candidum TaxID=119954 RepID=A0ACB9QKV7_9MYRT|nr:hypothetical protein MLD38_022911 [Melastoma candidum]